MSQTIDGAISESLACDPVLIQTLSRRWAEKATAMHTQDFPLRSFELQLQDRTSHVIGEGNEPDFSIRIISERGRSALLSLDELAFAEAYINGDLDLEGDLLALLKCRPLLSDRHPIKYLFSTYVQPLLFGQPHCDKRWIKSHYDIDAKFFLLWLDEEIRSYSHGFFDREDEPLTVGMQRKFQYAFDAVGLAPGQRVLDIGGGWGSFLEFASTRGVHVTSITISDASEAFMKELIKKRGLSGEVVKEHFLEYRSSEPFDAIVNLGVTEHLPDYRRSLAQYQRLLKPGCRVYLDAYSGTRHSMPSFIRRWVFEGNTSPLCLKTFLTEVARTPFEVVLIKNDRQNYFLTCKKWAHNLALNRDEIISRWGEQLYRRFILYLFSAANSFETGSLSAHRMILQLPSRNGARNAAVEALN